jgi:hypothetical protein
MQTCVKGGEKVELKVQAVGQSYKEVVSFRREIRFTGR